VDNDFHRSKELFTLFEGLEVRELDDDYGSALGKGTLPN
jgi:hypothetical protein